MTGGTHSPLSLSSPSVQGREMDSTVAGACAHAAEGWGRSCAAEGRSRARATVKALDWFWIIDETLSANLVYQDDYEIGSTTPSDEAMTKIMTMVIAW